MHRYFARKAFEHWSWELDVLLVSNASLAAYVWRGVEYLLLWRWKFFFSFTDSHMRLSSSCLFHVWTVTLWGIKLWMAYSGVRGPSCDVARCNFQPLSLCIGSEPLDIPLFVLLHVCPPTHIILQHSGWIESLFFSGSESSPHTWWKALILRHALCSVYHWGR